MKKNSLLKTILKSGAMLVLSLSLAIPAGIAQTNVYAEAATLIEKYDFEKGVRGFRDDANYALSASGGLYIQKIGEQIEVGEDRTEANGLLISGSGAEIKYNTQPVANSPSTSFDAERGTVFTLCNTYEVPEVIKEVSALTDGVSEDEAAVLDRIIEVGSVVREAGTYKSYMTFTNPMAEISSENAVLAFWGKVPADSTDEKLAFIQFGSDETAVNFNYDSAVVNRGEWHYYTYVIGKDAITAYVDGKASEMVPVIDGANPEDYVAFLKSSVIYLGATNESSLVTVEETSIDNISVYDGTMTSEEVAALYNDEVAAANRKADIANPLALYTMDKADQFVTLNEEYPANIESFNINGHEVKGVAVPENAKGIGQKIGIKLAENPFAGKSLEGLTVGYWIQVEVKAKKLAAGKDVIDNTVSLSFIDELKPMVNPKEEVKNRDAFSYLYMKTNMETEFREGAYFDINIGNNYTIDVAEELSDEYVDASREWHYITLTVNNDELVVYRDGVKMESGGEPNRGARFFDGYYRRMGQRELVTTLYGMFGGSGNQGANMIMTVLGYEDTGMYFGWLPMKDTQNETTSPMNVSRISCYDIDMTADEVKALYEQELSTINAMPEYKDSLPTEDPDTTLAGDLNKDGRITAQDALIALKIAAKMIDATEEDLAIGDINEDGKVDAKDALKMLRIAAKLE